MDWLLLFARLTLGAVFLVAAVGKLADRQNPRQTLAEFGVPNWLRAPVALLLPFVELTVAAVLILGISARWGALAALGLLFIFIVGIAINLARGNKPNCHCFGQLHSAPVGWSTLIRNGLLAAVAGLVFWHNGENVELGSTVASAGFNAATWIALAVAMVGVVVAAFEGWFLLNLLRQQGRFLIRLETLEAALGVGPGTGLSVGEQAREFQLLSLGGEQSTLATLRGAGLPVLLFFTNPDCEPCDAILPDVARWQREHADRVTIGVIGRGSIEANRVKAEKHDLRTVLLQKEREVIEAYKIDSTPAAVLVSPDGKISSRVGYGAEGVEDLLGKALNRGTSTLAGPMLDEGNGHGIARVSAPSIGQAAPPLVFSDLDGKSANLADLQGTTTLVLFWNPECSFCQRMLPTLKTWERKRAAWSPQVLVISTGTVETNRAMGLASRIVLDSEGLAMRAFAATGTPMAVLLDGSGRIASALTAGEQAVMALARTRHHETLSLSS